jgi:hypothetical protein
MYSLIVLFVIIVLKFTKSYEEFQELQIDLVRRVGSFYQVKFFLIFIFES